MSKTIKIGIAVRVQLIGVFNQVKGDVETLEAVLKDIPQVSLSEEDKKKCKFAEVLDKDGNLTSYKWDTPFETDIELSDKSVAFFTKHFKEKNKAQQLSLADAPLMEINKKINNE